MTGPGILYWTQQKPGEHHLRYPWSCACSSYDIKAGFNFRFMVPETIAVNFTASEFGLHGAQ